MYTVNSYNSKVSDSRIISANPCHSFVSPTLTPRATNGHTRAIIVSFFRDGRRKMYNSFHPLARV